MFTGIIENVGNVAKLGPSVVSIATSFADVKLGESVSINGICLTATKMIPSSVGSVIDFDFTPETRQRTNIEQLKVGSRVNLERALRVGDRFGGHIMTGHIEGKGTIVRKENQDNSWLFFFSVDEILRKYIVPKGSVGVDGISLTVVGSRKGEFSVSVIPHTLENTNLGQRKAGDAVNIEPDILAKYVENMIHTSGSGKITEEFLREHGFTN